MKLITILLAEDLTVGREGLWKLLAARDDLEGEAPAATVASDPKCYLILPVLMKGF